MIYTRLIWIANFAWNTLFFFELHLMTETCDSALHCSNQIRNKIAYTRYTRDNFTPKRCITLVLHLIIKIIFGAHVL